MARTATAIERRYRQGYREKRDELDGARRHALDLAEESILTEPSSLFRRVDRDGTVYDLSEFDVSGLILTFRLLSDGTQEFLDFVFLE